MFLMLAVFSRNVPLYDIAIINKHLDVVGVDNSPYAIWNHVYYITDDNGL